MDQESPVKIISASDVTYSVDSAILALEISNDFLLQVRREGKSLLEEINKGISSNAITLDKNSTRLRSTLEKTVGKLFTKFTRAKGGTERKKIKDGKTRVTVSCGETVDSIAMEDRLQQAEVNACVWYIK